MDFFLAKMKLRLQRKYTHTHKYSNTDSKIYCCSIHHKWKYEKQKMDELVLDPTRMKQMKNFFLLLYLLLVLLLFSSSNIFLYSVTWLYSDMRYERYIIKERIWRDGSNTCRILNFDVCIWLFFFALYYNMIFIHLLIHYFVIRLSSFSK